ncbi:MAG TPA: proprotein convertase P-domain-containing protein [Vicinamibacteria bacterium]|nr:proprotein convertase P-domain-containing protein [Vicinamibacteria bacterium]
MNKSIKVFGLVAIAVALAFGAQVYAQVTATSTNVPLPIPDNGNVNSTLNFPVSTTNGITDVDVQFSITHTWDSDVRVTIAAPSVAAVTVMENCGGSGDNFTSTRISDQGAAGGCAFANAPFTGTFQARQGAGTVNATALSAFNVSTQQSGTWTLNVADDSSICTGTLTAWSVIVSGPPPLPVELMNFQVK